MFDTCRMCVRCARDTGCPSSFLHWKCKRASFVRAEIGDTVAGEECVPASAKICMGEWRYNGDYCKNNCHDFETVSTPVPANPLVGCIEIALVPVGAACCWSEGNMDDCDSGNDNLVAAAR